MPLAFGGVLAPHGMLWLTGTNGHDRSGASLQPTPKGEDMPEKQRRPQPPELSAAEAEAVLQRLATPASPPPNGSAKASPRADSMKGVTAEPIAPQTTNPLQDPKSLLTAENLRGLIEAVPDALVIVDHLGRIVLVNHQTERLFGYRREELTGQLIEVLVPERFRERHVGQRNSYFAAPHERPMGKGLELFGRRKDGHDVPVEISLSPLVTSAGPLVVSSIRDVSERKRAEIQLRKMEARYRTLVEGIPAVTFMASLEDETTERELYVSPQIEELLGFSQREWVENPILWFTQLHPDDRNRWHEEFARTCAEGQHFRSVYRFLARDGHVVWVHGEAQVVRDESGRPLFLQGVAFDITGIKRAEEELRALNQTLAERVAERTLEVEERAAELARSNQALNEFTYVVTHDLREPLRTINSFIQKLVDHYEGQFDATAQDYVARTVNAGKRMGTLIVDLLAYSRVGSEVRTPEPVECDRALHAALANLQASLEETGADVTADPLPIVVVAPSQLAQLFQNLISNALKFRGEESPRIHVSASRVEDGWEIAVADNGIGIEPHSLERIFRLGVESRLYNRTKYPGHGIGLATCQKIIERHGGRIWATSDGPGKGTTIHFTLPAIE